MAEKNFPVEFGRYRLTALLGAGGMAEVFRAETAPVAGITREVAIKRLLHGMDASGDFRNMLLDEARIWVRLRHPNIVTVLEIGEHDDDFFLALELVEGVTCSQILRHSGPLSVREALAIVERVARALDYAHTLADKGTPLQIVHRDVKPANIMISTRGEVKLTDFGIARATDRISRTEVGMIKGSLPFLAPEQIRGQAVDGRTDLFALGCTLHTLLTGRTLIEKTREALMIALDRGEIPLPPSELPPAVQALLRSLTAPRAADRPADAKEVARQIRSILQPELVEDVEPALGVKSAAALEAQSKPGKKDKPPVPVALGPKPVDPPLAHPSWREPDISALPPDDDLDAVRSPAPRPAPAPPIDETTPPQPRAAAKPKAAPAPVPKPARPVEPAPQAKPTDLADAFEIAPQLTESPAPPPRKPILWRIALVAFVVSLIALGAIVLPRLLQHRR